MIKVTKVYMGTLGTCNNEGSEQLASLKSNIIILYINIMFPVSAMETIFVIHAQCSK